MMLTWRWTMLLMSSMTFRSVFLSMPMYAHLCASSFNPSVRLTKSMSGMRTSMPTSNGVLGVISRPLLSLYPMTLTDAMTFSSTIAPDSLSRLLSRV